MATESYKSLTLRVPQPLYERAKRAAKKHGTSLNELARKGLQELTNREQLAELQSQYESMGSDAETEVEGYFAAQQEVLDEER